jgi:hypothetical protein
MEGSCDLGHEFDFLVSVSGPDGTSALTIGIGLTALASEQA